MVRFFRERKNRRTKGSILNYHRILVINMHYKNNMPPFHALSMEGGRKWQEVISYTLSTLIMARSQFIKRNNL